MPLKPTLTLLVSVLISLSGFATPTCDPSFITSYAANGDTVCVGSLIEFTNTSNLSGNLVSTQWNFGDASAPANTENATHTYSAPGLYVVSYSITSQSCTGLIVKDTVYVILPPTLQDWATPTHCFGSCDGTANIFITGPHSNYSINWDAPGSPTTETAPDLCHGSYIAVVSDPYGCSTVSASITVGQPAPIVVEAGPDIYTCEGSSLPFSSATVISGGVGSLDYLWDPTAGLTTSTNLNPVIDILDNASFASYTLTVTDDDGCEGSDFLTVIEDTATISGTVTDVSGSPLTGKVYLIMAGPLNQPWTYLDTVTIGSGGEYTFYQVPLIDVIVLAQPTGGGGMPTYWGNEFAWTDAHVINTQCGTTYLNTDIQCTTLLPTTGDCDLHGTVYLSTVGKTQTDDPIPFIDVVVKKTPPGNAISHTQTNPPGSTEGEFTFQNMGPSQAGTVYTFIVNYPGLTMRNNDSITVTIDDILYDNLNFYVDTTWGSGGIWTYNPLGIKNIKRAKTDMLAYPNPFSDNCLLEFENEGKFIFILSDITGKVITTSAEQKGNTYLIDTKNIGQGMYIAEVRTDKEVFRTRILKN